MKKAIIFGIAGQDGSYLAELLLSKKYEVYGMIRRCSVAENQDSRIYHLAGLITTVYGDLLDETSIDKLIADVQPDEVYNLAAQSHVRISADMPRFTAKVNAIGALNILESCRLHCPTAKVYQASSSEMFGNCIDDDGFQRETTPMHPVSSYGCAKLFSYSMFRHYRRSYDMFACNGILFNHESPRRGSNFVTSKVVKTAVEIKLNLTNNLILGNMDSYRDWGHSKDYCINLDVPILTTDGWKFYEDINIGDVVINFDTKNSRITQDVVNDKVLFNTTGDKIVFKGRGVHISVTPHHRIYYQKKSINSKGGWSNWKITYAEDLASELENLSTREKYNYRLPHFQDYNANDIHDVSDDQLYLIGALMCEGWLGQNLKTKNSGIQIGICQSTIVNEPICKKIINVINNLGLEYNTTTRNDGVCIWTFDSQSSRTILEWFDKPNIHIMPKWLYSLSSRQANIIFESMMDCDGCWGAMSFCSKRSLLISDFQTISCLAGYRTCCVKTDKNKNIHRVTAIVKPKKHQYIQNVDRINDGHTQVWCVKTNNGTIITRDKGCINISGNCRAMYMIMQHEEPDDFVISTMQTHSVRDLCEYVFAKLGLDYRNYVTQDEKFLRPEELKLLKGDSSRARKILGWEPKYTFETLLDDMVDYWSNKLGGG